MNNTRPAPARISVIIPVYQVEKDIEACLQSLLLQGVALEILLIDDCGRDHSIDIARQHADNAPLHLHFRIIQHEQNRGVSAARNTGLDAATGDYIYYLDGDDSLPKGALKQLLKLAEESQADICMGQVSTHSGQNIAWLQATCPALLQGQESLEQLFAGNIPQSAFNKLIKRSYLQEQQVRFNEQYSIHEDMLWCIQLCNTQPKIATCNHPSYHYKDERENSVTQKLRQERQEHKPELARQRQQIGQEYQKLAQQHQFSQLTSYKQFYHHYMLTCIQEWSQIQQHSNWQRYLYYKTQLKQIPPCAAPAKAPQKEQLFYWCHQNLPAFIAALILISL